MGTQLPMTKSWSLTPKIKKIKKFPRFFCLVSDNAKLLHTLPVFESTLSDSSGSNRSAAECFGVNRGNVSLQSHCLGTESVSAGSCLLFSQYETNGMRFSIYRNTLDEIYFHFHFHCV